MAPSPRLTEGACFGAYRPPAVLPSGLTQGQVSQPPPGGSRTVPRIKSEGSSVGVETSQMNPAPETV